jgi:hypothetical protein
MSIQLPPDRDAAQVEALVADRYLEALLAAADRRAGGAPADAALDPDVRDAARVLRAALVRVHPSFRFEERLAARLADLAAAQAVPGMAVGGGRVLPFRPRVAGSAVPPEASPGADPLLAAVLAGDLDPADADAVDRAAGAAAARRPLLVGGAITSAAISIVGVAWVAWRASRPTTRSGSGRMGRAARTAHARRARTAALAGLGLGGPA